MSLDQIAIRCGTDKSSKHHDYCKIYSTYFEPLRNEPITLFEIGAGAYWKYNEGFHSHKMWREYFSKGRIIAIDIHDKDPRLHEGIEFYNGSQVDKEFLDSIPGEFDIVIDDGSHHNDHTSQTFHLLWPRVKSGGYYVIEDVHTSYFSEHYGGTKDPHGHNTMNYFKRLADHLNYEAAGLKNFNLEFIHFYKEIIFIKKK